MRVVEIESLADFDRRVSRGARSARGWHVQSVDLSARTTQLATLDANTQEAVDVRKLIGEQLPAFVKDYEKVPASLRTTPRNGRSPDAELVDGLKLIEQEIGEMTARLAQSDLDNLSTRGRFLEMKYKD